MMKKYSMLVILLTLISSNSYAQWEIKSSNVNVTLSDICFADSLHGWAVGDSGTIIKTIDGGHYWTIQTKLADSIELKKVQFFNNKTGFVAGITNHKVSNIRVQSVFAIRTNDGGNTWINIDSMFTIDDNFAAMEFLDSLNGWLGVNYSRTPSIPKRKGYLYKTTNAGVSWIKVFQKDSMLLGALSFSDSSNAVSFWSSFFDNYEPSYVLTTDNGGNTWSSRGKIIEELVTIAKAVSPDSIWSLGDKVSISFDNGQLWKSWIALNPVIIGNKRIKANNVISFSAQHVWIAGTAFSSPDDREGIVLSTTNAGNAWQLDYSVLGYRFLGISKSLNKVWVCGSNGFIACYSNNTLNISQSQIHSPLEYSLLQNYPNPFNPNTTIEYSLTKPGSVTISIYSILGEKLFTLVNELKDSGSHKEVFNASSLSSGIYFYELRVNGFTNVKRMTVLK